MPPVPKDPSTRRRRNVESTATTLVRRKGGRRPTIPIRNAHPQTKAWWADVWNSPMSGQYTEPDRDGLVMLCMLVEDFWTADTSRERRELAAEIRQQGVRFGLSPIDRRRLQWRIEPAPAPAAAERTRPAGRAVRAVPNGPDPRSVLQAV